MRSRLLAPISAALALALALALPLGLGAGPAAASCAAPPPGSDGQPEVVFTGVMIEKVEGEPGPGDHRYRWRVERAERGDPPPELVAVMAVDQREPGPNGERWATSSVSVGPEPIAGQRYRVGGRWWDSPDGRVLSVNLCDGFLEATGSGADAPVGTAVHHNPDQPLAVTSGPAPAKPDPAVPPGSGAANPGDPMSHEIATTDASAVRESSPGALGWVAAGLLLVAGAALTGVARAGRT